MRTPGPDTKARPRSASLAAALATVESPGVTTLSDGWPIFWESAAGSHVTDVDGHSYIDLTAAFGVAGVGHANARVTKAVAEQAGTLLHGMGDVHPPAVKVRLLQALVDRAPSGLDCAVLGLNGSDAVEVALKCAELVTGRPGLIAFEGAYHGLAGGALSVTARRDFRTPFAGRLGGPTTFAPYPRSESESERVLAELERKLARRSSGLPATGALIVEPIQGRGGIRVAPAGFLTGLRALCDRHELLLIIDEIFTGLGRTGAWFACEHEGVRPDLLCLGKALGGGMPISACLGGETSLRRWPPAAGEALHTSTFLGHPGACAAALATLAELEERALPERARRLGERAMMRLSDWPVEGIRGRGLMLGVELFSGAMAMEVVRRALEAGVLLLPSGDDGEVLSITPPLTIAEETLDLALDTVRACLVSVGGGGAPPLGGK